MKNNTYYDIDTTSPEVISIIRDDANSFKTCHLCGKNKPHMMFSFLTFKLDRVERDFWDYAAFVWMWALSALSLLARWHSRVMTKVPWDHFYQLIPLHLWVCRNCIKEKTNWKWKLIFKESDYKKHPLYPKVKELWYKKVVFQESYVTDDLAWKSFQKDLIKNRKLVKEMDESLNIQPVNDGYLSNNAIDMSRKIYDEYGFDEDWYNREWYDVYWYDREGFNKEWWNRKWYDRNWYDEDWFNVKWYDENWYDREWYNVEWYNRQWYNREWWSIKWIYKGTWELYDKNWFDKNWKHKDTWIKYDCKWYDKNWYDKDWYNKDWRNNKWEYKNLWYRMKEMVALAICVLLFIILVFFWISKTRH